MGQRSSLEEPVPPQEESKGQGRFPEEDQASSVVRIPYFEDLALKELKLLKTFFEIKPPVSLLRGDALKWWRLLYSSPRDSGFGYDHFKAALLAGFRTTDPVRDARDQLSSLKQTKSVRAYSSAFRTTLSIPGLSSAEALDRDLNPTIKVQAMLHAPKTLENAMRLAETYDSIIFAESRKRDGVTTARPVARSSDPDAMEIDAIHRVHPAKLTPELGPTSERRQMLLLSQQGTTRQGLPQEGRPCSMG